MSFFSRVVSTIRIHGGTILKSSLISSLPWLPVVYTVDSAVVTVANITGTSMQPTLSERDMVLIRKAFYTPSRGDVVILRYVLPPHSLHSPSLPFSDPRRPKGSILKRLVALEGDVVEIDPEELPETGAVPWLDFHQPLITGDSVFVQVPRGHCWVEGDNSETSIDSRFYGPVCEGLCMIVVGPFVAC